MVNSYAVCTEEEGRLRRRRAVESLLVFANELERTQRISKASKGLLKGAALYTLLTVCIVCTALGVRFLFLYRLAAKIYGARSMYPACQTCNSPVAVQAVRE